MNVTDTTLQIKCESELKYTYLSVTHTYMPTHLPSNVTSPLYLHSYLYLLREDEWQEDIRNAQYLQCVSCIHTQYVYMQFKKSDYELSL